MFEFLDLGVGFFVGIFLGLVFMFGRSVYEAISLWILEKKAERKILDRMDYFGGNPFQTDVQEIFEDLRINHLSAANAITGFRYRKSILKEE